MKCVKAVVYLPALFLACTVILGCDLLGLGKEEAVVDYVVESVNVLTSGVISENVNANFTIANKGNAAGIADIDWTVYVASGGSYAAGDKIAEGEINALAAAASSTVLSFSEPLPATAGTYNMFIVLAAADDSNGENNSSITEIAVSPVPTDGVDYGLSNFSVYTDGFTNSGFTGGFTISNFGDVNGGEQIDWSLYLSSDTLFDGGDTAVTSGFITALNLGESSAEIDFSSNWPLETNTWYLIVTVSAADDVAGGNDTYVSNPIDITLAVTRIDYLVSVPVFPGDGYTGAPFSGSFVITNNGTTDGSELVHWRLYISDDEFAGTTDTVADVGDQTALATGASSGTINFGWNWPSTEGTYYLIIEAIAADDENPANNDYVSNAVTVTTAPRFVAVGASGHIGVSCDEGDSWYPPADTPAGTPDLFDIVYNDFLLVAVGETGSMWTSSDRGDTWQEQVSGTIADLHGITYGNGIYVAVGHDGTDGVSIRSTDALTWSDPAETTGAAGFHFDSVTFGGSRFVAVEGSNGNTVRYSNNGIDWTASTLSSVGARCHDITYWYGSPTSYFYIGAGESLDTAHATIFYSTDAITWSEIAVLPGQIFWGIDDIDGGTTVAVGSNGRVYNNGNFGSNPGGWADVSSNTFHNYAVTSGNGMWITVGESGGAWYSWDNALSWTDASVPLTTLGDHLWSVAYQP